MIKRAVIFLVNMLPESFFMHLREKMNQKTSYRFDALWYYRTQKRWDRLIKDIDSNKNEEVCLISRGAYDYDRVNVCFISNVLELCLYSIALHKMPMIDIKDSSGTNMWNLYFEQPWKPQSNSRIMNCNQKSFYYFSPHWDSIFQDKELRF